MALAIAVTIGVIVAAMEAEHDAEESAGRQELQDDQAAILSEIRALREEVRELKRSAGAAS